MPRPSKQQHAIDRARRLRRDLTGPERALWSALRDRRLAGLKFRRQHAIGPFIADFYCDEKQLVIELDGKSHEGRAAYDRRREEYLVAQGFRVLRFDNDDVLREGDAVLAAILLACGIKP